MLPSYSSTTTKTTELHKLIHNIKTLKSGLSHTHHKQVTIRQQLKHNEFELRNLIKKIAATKKELKIKLLILKRLHHDRDYYHTKLRIQQENLAQQMRATYMLGNQAYFKLLLNNQTPSSYGRILAYYKYLQQSRLKLIATLNNTLTKLHRNSKEITIQTEKLQALKNKQQQEYHKLSSVKQHRVYLLHLINRKIKHQKQRLTKMLADKEALEKIIDRLKNATISATFATPLNRLRKKLRWPAQGKVENLYGSRIANSQLKWHGVIIKTLNKQKVYAISDGKVVFAQWLQGYGLLLIINHGHGYMSLYGRNSALYKKVGDTIHAKTLIATAGLTLYFAIRHNGEPVNPSLWCK